VPEEDLLGRREEGAAPAEGRLERLVARLRDGARAEVEATAEVPEAPSSGQGGAWAASSIAKGSPSRRHSSATALVFSTEGANSG